jgi:hypothetical protein
LNLSSWSLTIWVCDPEKKPIPDPGTIKAPDPGSKTLPVNENVLIVNRKIVRRRRRVG